METDQYLPYLIVIGLVAAVAVVSLIFSGNVSIEGASINRYTLDEAVSGCVDDDPANDRYVAGTVKRSKTGYIDFCQGNRLNQYYCGSASRARLMRSFNCPNGCLDGACIR